MDDDTLPVPALKPEQPTQGGTYERMADGSLREIEAPTKPAKFVPETKE